MQGLKLEVALRNRDQVDPRDINTYIERCRGYSGLRRAMEMGSGAVIEELLGAGLEDGAAAALAAAAWQRCREAAGDQKYVICSAVDGDPDSDAARVLLAGDPHSVLEGLLIAAYCVGATRCFLGVNADYEEEISLLELALRQAGESGLLEGSVAGAAASVDVSILRVPASPATTEETALIRAAGGRQPLPFLRAAEDSRGVLGEPTSVVNAETLSVISAILQEHPAVSRVAAGRVAGTKIVTVSDADPDPGDRGERRTLEVPLGTAISSLLEQLEGRPFDQLDVMAVQFGGSTGPFLLGEALHTPITPALIEGSGCRSGSVKVFRTGSCGVEMSRRALARAHEQSCGICVFCREGTRQLAAVLQDLAECRAKAEDLDLLRELAASMEAGSICAHGRRAGAPVLTGLEAFAADYASHLSGGACQEGGK